MVEQDCYAFFVELVCENLPLLCSYCQVIDHDFVKCRKRTNVEGLKDSSNGNKPLAKTAPPRQNMQYVPKEANKDPEPIANAVVENGTTAEQHLHSTGVIHVERVLVTVPPCDPLGHCASRPNGSNPLMGFIANPYLHSSGEANQGTDLSNAFVDVAQESGEGGNPHSSEQTPLNREPLGAAAIHYNSSDTVIGRALSTPMEEQLNVPGNHEDSPQSPLLNDNISNDMRIMGMLWGTMLIRSQTWRFRTPYHPLEILLAALNVRKRHL